MGFSVLGESSNGEGSNGEDYAIFFRDDINLTSVLGIFNFGWF